MLHPLWTRLGRSGLRLAGGSCEHCKGLGRAGCSCIGGQAQLQLRGGYSTAVQTWRKISNTCGSRP